MKNKVMHAAAIAVAASCLIALAPKAHSQVSINIGVGAPPSCPYGYFDYAPYNCAPYGYYGPTWFVNGVFIGAGRWFHGPANFHGYVNNRFDPRHGYHGAIPRRGARPDVHHRPGAINNFRGNEMHNGRGDERGHGDQRDHGGRH
jgi:hypothetical protein